MHFLHFQLAYLLLHIYIIVGLQLLLQSLQSFDLATYGSLLRLNFVANFGLLFPLEAQLFHHLFQLYWVSLRIL